MDMITQFVILLVLALLVVFNFVDKSNKTAEIQNNIEYYVNEDDNTEYEENHLVSEDE